MDTPAEKEPYGLWYNVLHEHLSQYKALPAATCFNILLVLLKERKVISFLYCEDVLMDLTRAIRLVLDIKDIKISFNQNKIFVYDGELKIDDKTEDDNFNLASKENDCKVHFSFNGASFMTFDIIYTEAKVKFLRANLDRYKKIARELASGVSMSVIF